MRRSIFTLFLCAGALWGIDAAAQQGGVSNGFGGMQYEMKLQTSTVWHDVNYAGDGQAYHTCDIYLPIVQKPAYPVVVHIYGSAWFSNNGKGSADLGTIVNALLNAGYAVVCPNHRSSSDAAWPAQINDIKAVIRFIRGEAARYKFDPSFVATSGFSSGGHLSSLCAVTNGVGKVTVAGPVNSPSGAAVTYPVLDSDAGAASAGVAAGSAQGAGAGVGAGRGAGASTGAASGAGAGRGAAPSPGAGQMPPMPVYKAGNVKDYGAAETIDIEGAVGNYLNESSSVNAAADWSGPVDVFNMECGRHMSFGASSPEDVLVRGTRESTPNKYLSLGYLPYIDASDVPTIIFHGEEDFVVPVCQGKRFFEDLKAAGVKTEATFVPGAGHGNGMYGAENLAKMVRFFDEVRN